MYRAKRSEKAKVDPWVAWEYILLLPSFVSVVLLLKGLFSGWMPIVAGWCYVICLCCYAIGYLGLFWLLRLLFSKKRK